MFIKEKEPEDPKQIAQIMHDLSQLEEVFSQIETVHDQNKIMLNRYPGRYTSYVLTHSHSQNPASESMIHEGSN